MNSTILSEKEKATVLGLISDKAVAVVVPCYNEETQIGKVIETMPKYVNRIVIVNDKSKDRTAEVVNDYVGASSGRIVLINHEVNQGVGGAIATGYKWCAQNDVDIAVVMAGDGQMDPNDLLNIIAPVAKGEVDYAKGNRFFYGDSLTHIPFVRLFGNSILSFLTKIASGYWHISDSQTGYTSIGKNALQTVQWDMMYKRYGMPNDLLVRLNVFNFSVRDVVIKPVYHVGEQSKMNVKKVVFTLSWLLLKLFCWRMKEKYILRDFHPLVLFYLLGALMSAVSIAFFIRLLFLWVSSGAVPEITFLSWMFSSTIGLLSIFFAMMFDMESNRHLR